MTRKSLQVNHKGATRPASSSREAYDLQRDEAAFTGALSEVIVCCWIVVSNKRPGEPMWGSPGLGPAEVGDTCAGTRLHPHRASRSSSPSLQFWRRSSSRSSRRPARSARQTTCLSNLKQIGVSVRHVHGGLRQLCTLLNRYDGVYVNLPDGPIIYKNTQQNYMDELYPLHQECLGLPLSELQVQQRGEQGRLGRTATTSTARS